MLPTYLERFLRWCVCVLSVRESVTRLCELREAETTFQNNQMIDAHNNVDGSVINNVLNTTAFPPARKLLQSLSASPQLREYTRKHKI